jgi:DNA repair protein RecN (Recombination protein N)
MPRAELVELDVAGLGPIGHARVEFGPGFNVLTGETGAGKTLLVGALTLCLGESDARLTRGESTRVSALFRAQGTEVALSREVSGGRLRGAIDQIATSAEGLRARAAQLIAIHGQHDSLRLRTKGEALRMIDEYGEIDDSELRALRSTVRELTESRDRFGGDAAVRAREIEFIRFQLRELDEVNPTGPDELERTLEELTELVAMQEGRDEAFGAIDALDGEGDDTVITRLIRESLRIPEAGAVGEHRRRLLALAEETRELVREMAREAESLELDDAALDRLTARAEALQQIARKHGGTLAAAVEARDRLRLELAAREAAEVALARVDEDLASALAEEARVANVLRQQRHEAGARFAEAVASQFERVALAGARFAVRVDGVDGSDVDLLFSANPGSELGPLGSLASGGELSRVLLAISLETVDDDLVAVFDEVDAGVGGSVAQQIGECLSELATRQQVIVVTHLASVAARAQRHFVVDKVVGADDAITTVREVRGEERVAEIARMLAGESGLRESRALAERLLTGL